MAEIPYARCPYCLSIIGKYDENNNIIPLSEEQIIELKSSGVKFWTNDPIFTKSGALHAWDEDDDNEPILIFQEIKDRKYKGFNQSLNIHIKEIQDARTNQEIDVGIEEEDRTTFSPVESGGELSYFQLNKKHILELRQSTEKILNVIGWELSTYLNYTEEFQLINTYNEDNDLQNKFFWTDSHDEDAEGNFSWSYEGHPKNIHIEDLRHQLSLTWIEKFEKAFTTEQVSKTINNYENEWIEDERIDGSLSTRIFPDKADITFIATDRNYWAYSGAFGSYSTTGANIDAGQRTSASMDGLINITNQEKYHVTHNASFKQAYPDPQFTGITKGMSYVGNDTIHYSSFAQQNAQYYPENLENNLVIWSNGFKINKNTRFSFDLTDISTHVTWFGNEINFQDNPAPFPNTVIPESYMPPAVTFTIVLEIFHLRGRMVLYYLYNNNFDNGYTNENLYNNKWYGLGNISNSSSRICLSLEEFQTFNRNIYDDILDAGGEFGITIDDIFDKDGIPIAYIKETWITGGHSFGLLRKYAVLSGATGNLEFTIDNVKLFYGRIPIE